MSTNTGIAWTDHTFNPWWGCTKVSPGCASCYAERDSQRHGWSVWGKDTARRFFTEKHWAEPYRWDRAAAKEGRRRRVFCASMADVFEDRPDLREPRESLWRLIADTPHLDWQVLTKRPENFRRMLPKDWLQRPPDNLWLGVSAEDQARADERIPPLLRTPAAVRFVSAEPLLGPINFLSLSFTIATGRMEPDRLGSALDWVIVGGESGPGARPCDLAWVRSIVQQCKVAGVACFVKQLGAQPTECLSDGTDSGEHDDVPLELRDRKGGDPEEWPEGLAIQEFPR